MEFDSSALLRRKVARLVMGGVANAKPTFGSNKFDSCTFLRGRLVKREDGELQPRKPRFDSEIDLRIFLSAELGWLSVALPRRSPRVRLPLRSPDTHVWLSG